MKVLPTTVPGVMLFEPQRFEDARGYFYEAIRLQELVDLGVHHQWVQENRSFSKRNVIRGIHYQWPEPQAKIVEALAGEIFDVAVDIRPESPTYLQSFGTILSRENHRMLYIPEGFAHGFSVISDGAHVSYKCSRYYNRTFDRAIRWDDRQIAIEWMVQNPILSQKDLNALPIAQLSREDLPTWV